MLRSSAGVSSIAYLGPEIPALSATFVYEEILALSSRGLRTTIFSVHKPTSIAVGHEDLMNRTHYLYGSGKIWAGLKALACVRLNAGSFEAVRLLFKDIRKVGIFSVSSLSLSYQCLIAFRLASLMKMAGSTHLHVHFAHVPTQIAMYASVICGVPFTMVGHANDIFQRPLLLKEKAERSKRFITISDYNCQHLVKLGVPSDKLSVVRCGVSLEVKSIFKPWRTGASIRIGSIGRLVEKKGFDILQQAVAALVRKDYPITLSIAGDGPLKRELIDQGLRLSMTDHFELLGAIPHSEVAQWIDSLDVFVLACKLDVNGDIDGIPVVLMEAMARGVPVISTSISGIPELVVDGQTGLLARPGDVLDLAEKIETLLSSPDLANTMITNAALHVAQEFGRDVNVSRLIAHIEAK
jgi:colanic acid/amylovoran biosynthesis glycosyltransferase